DPGYSELTEDLRDQRFSRRVQRPGVDDAVAGPNEGHQQGRDGRHAAGKSERVVGVFPQRQTVLENLLIGTVEPRIDQPFRASGALAGNALEESFACRGALEHEGRGEEDRGLKRALAELRVEAIAEHQGLRAEIAVADPGRRWTRRALMGAIGRNFAFGGQFKSPL